MKYPQTHPWLTFSVKDLERAEPKLWVVLGQCQSKCEHISKVPLLPETREELNKVYLVKGALATTAIEGNSLSEKEVRKLLDGELRLPPSKEYLAQEVRNIIEASNEILQKVLKNESLKITVLRVKELNTAVLKDLEMEAGVIPGRIRVHSVTVGRYRGAPPKDCEWLLENLCRWLGEMDQPPAGLETAYSILKAIIAHLYLAWIHPFGDGNGRTARLVEFQILLDSGVPAPAAHLLSNHYNQTRAEYYRKLDQASRAGDRGDILPFIEYAAQGLLDGLGDQLVFIHEQQRNVMWENYVHSVFKDRTGPARDRHRHLVLDLSRKSDQPYPIKDLPDISARVSRSYAKMSSITMTRDLDTLSRSGLLEVTGTYVRIRKEIVLSMLPPKAVKP